MQPAPSSTPHDADDGTPSAPQQPSPENDEGSTWGLGSASALESLRRQNFRGRRGQPGEERPQSR